MGEWCSAFQDHHYDASKRRECIQKNGDLQCAAATAWKQCRRLLRLHGVGVTRFEREASRLWIRVLITWQRISVAKPKKKSLTTQKEGQRMFVLPRYATVILVYFESKLYFLLPFLHSFSAFGLHLQRHFLSPFGRRRAKTGGKLRTSIKTHLTIVRFARVFGTSEQVTAATRPSSL
jgi:hypothetical protein